MKMQSITKTIIRQAKSKIKKVLTLIIFSSILTVSCEGERRKNEQALEGYNIKNNPGWYYLMFAEAGIFTGGCEGEAQRKAKYIIEAEKETTMETTTSSSLIDILFKISKNKNLKMTFTPLDAGCLYNPNNGFSFKACNGLLNGSPSYINCSDFSNFGLSSGPVICKLNILNQTLTSLWGTLRIDSASVGYKCKVSILIQYE
ncbi:MAG: hypothetical protein HUU45_13550 [Leptospiraceae bacterium]|uniref:hypothetical protein n=1 Tax=Flavobacterium sp. TaxID=239 RepID=UPI00178EC794|nr:hypothetical protein [Flavobacterium sp.]MCK6609370.1 hypothetical protein [Flavobacterium sp.]NUM42645.1 hypothetical protein [Leptospiraceae bacterium]